MTNSLWATLSILLRAVSSHLFLWPTVCEWHHAFCERQSHHIFFHDQQFVSVAQFVKDSLITSFSWPTVCECHTVCERQFHHTFSHDQQSVSHIAHFEIGSLITPFLNREWVTFHTPWKAVLVHLFSWPTESEYWTDCERQSHHVFSYDQQSVSDRFVKVNLITSYDQQLVSDIVHFVKGCLIYDLEQGVSDMALNSVNGSLITWYFIFPMTNREWVTLHILWKAVALHFLLWPTDC